MSASLLQMPDGEFSVWCRGKMFFQRKEIQRGKMKPKLFSTGDNDMEVSHWDLFVWWQLLTSGREKLLMGRSWFIIDSIGNGPTCIIVSCQMKRLRCFCSLNYCKDNKGSCVQVCTVVLPKFWMQFTVYWLYNLSNQKIFHNVRSWFTCGLNVTNKHHSLMWNSSSKTLILLSANCKTVSKYIHIEMHVCPKYMNPIKKESALKDSRYWQRSKAT